MENKGITSKEIIESCKLVNTQLSGLESWRLSIKVAENISNSHGCNGWLVVSLKDDFTVYRLWNYYQIWRGKHWELYRKK